MRGQPSVQLWLVLLVFALLGVPVWRLTRPEASAAAPSSAALPEVVPASVTEFQVTAVCAPAPEEFRISALGQDVLAGRGAQAEFTTVWRTNVPAEGLDLAIQARWPATPDHAAPAAVRITVRAIDNAGRSPVERTFWATRGNLTELVTIPGSATP